MMHVINPSGNNGTQCLNKLYGDKHSPVRISYVDIYIYITPGMMHTYIFYRIQLFNMCDTFPGLLC